MERKWICVLFGWEEGKENFYVTPRYFPIGFTQNLSLQNGEKTRWGLFFLVSWATLPSLYIYIYIYIYIFLLISWAWCFVCFFFPSFFMVSWAMLPPLYYYYFYRFFLLISWVWCYVGVCVCGCFIILLFFLYLARNDYYYFFLEMIFKKNKFGWLFFLFLVAYHFFVFIWHHFLIKGIWVNIYKFIFFILPLFHSKPN